MDTRLYLSTEASPTKAFASAGKENMRENMTSSKSRSRKPLSSAATGHAKPALRMTTSATEFIPTSTEQKSRTKNTHNTQTEKEEEDTPEAIAARKISREKQIQYGYNTVGYQLYVASTPKNKRSRDMPRTPDKNQQCSKRSWDGQVRKWRRALHQWDPVELKEEWMSKQQITEKEDESVRDMVDKLLFEECDNTAFEMK
jgi:hypothetical protein